mgnify:CR=1 FL=1
MTERTAQQIANMKQQTIGVEVEMNHIKRSEAAKISATFFGTNRTEYTGGRNGYETYSAWDAQGREWKFQKDATDTALGQHGTAKAENGNFRRM